MYYTLKFETILPEYIDIQCNVGNLGNDSEKFDTSLSPFFSLGQFV